MSRSFAPVAQPGWWWHWAMVDLWDDSVTVGRKPLAGWVTDADGSVQPAAWTQGELRTLIDQEVTLNVAVVVVGPGEPSPSDAEMEAVVRSKAGEAARTSSPALEAIP